MGNLYRVVAKLYGDDKLQDKLTSRDRIYTGSLPVPTESAEQQAIFQWAALQCGAYPELALLYHIPNGGSRNKAEAGRLKAEGVKAGVPDLCLPVPRGPFHGLYIELKREQGGKTSEAQTEWITRLSEQGYFAVVCRGWNKAAEAIKQYLRLEAQTK